MTVHFAICILNGRSEPAESRICFPSASTLSIVFLSILFGVTDISWSSSCIREGNGDLSDPKFLEFVLYVLSTSLAKMHFPSNISVNSGIVSET